MKRILMIVLTLSLVAVIAMPAFAEVQNIKVNGSIIIRGFMRDNYATTGSGAGRAFSDGDSTKANTQAFAESGTTDWYNTQTRVGIAADLTDNVAATVVLGNERDWGVASTTTYTDIPTGDAVTVANTTEDVAIRSAYITMQEMLYSPLTVKVGRMPVQVADGLIIADAVTNEAFRGSDYADTNEWDAILGTLDYEPLMVHIGTAKMADRTQNAGDDVDVYVIDAIYKFENDMNAVLDTYYAQAHWDSPGAGNNAGPTGASTSAIDVYILAAVLNLEPMDALSAKLGIALQTGDYLKTAGNSRDLDAMAYDVALNYKLENEYTPVVGLKYIYRSGMENASTAAANSDYEGWLPLNENQTNGVIYDPNTNISAFALTATAVPADRLSLGLEYWWYTLAESQVAVPNATSTDDEAGSELDLMAKYAYTEDVSLGFNLAWFWPGDYYIGGNDETAMQAMVELGLKF